LSAKINYYIAYLLNIIVIVPSLKMLLLRTNYNEITKHILKRMHICLIL